MNGIEKKGIGERYLWKGVMVDEQDIHISLQDRGYVFGDGLYEVVRVYNGKLFGLKRHLDRLFQGAEIVKLNLHYTKEEFQSFFQQLVEENALHSGYVYMQLTRGDDGVRNHLFPACREQMPVLSGFAVHTPRNVEKIKAGTTAISVEDIRWKYCHVKTLNLIPNCMARYEAKKRGAAKAILVKDGIVTEEKSGSILIVQNGCILTHVENEDILPSTTKKILEALSEQEQIPFREGTFTLEELYAADEVIVADTNTECCAVLQVDGHLIGDGNPGPILKKLQKAYEAAIIAECGRAE